MATTDRFFRRGKTKVFFLPDVADLAAPTSSEITAGQELSTEISNIAGFVLSNSPIATPDLSSRFTKSIPGEETTEASTLTFYDEDVDASSNLIRASLPKDASGYILLCPYGKVTGRRAEVWPVRVTNNSDEYSMGNDPARYHVGFAISDVPEQNAVLP